MHPPETNAASIKDKSLSTILIVDDNPNNLRLLYRILSKMGWEIKASSSAKFALKSVKASPPDLIILDILMPEMDGIQLCGLLKQDPASREIPIIFISALNSTTDKVKAFQAGGVDYITKPFQDDEVVARVKTQLQIQQLRKVQKNYTDDLEKEVAKRTEALLKSEKRYSQLASSLPVGIWRTTPGHSGQFLLVNEALADIYGCRNKEELLKRKPADVYQNPADRQKFVEKVSRDGLVRRMELKLKKIDGTPITGLVTAHVIKDENGLPIYLDGILMDITEQKNAEAKNKELLEQLMHAQKLEAIGTLAGGIAHDFNNILNASIGFTELAMDTVGDTDESLEEYLSQIMAAGLRAKDLVKQILQFSRHNESDFGYVALKPILKEVTTLLKASLPSTIEINTRIKTNNDMVFADPGKIHQVFMNLCTNAFHAMRDKGGILDITLFNTVLQDKMPCTGGIYLDPGEYAVLSVKDSGRGMTQDLIAQIFNPYFTTKTRGEGTGLGLAITKSIVKSHDGGITVKSAPGEGTQFDVYFPVKAMEKPAAEIPQPIMKGGVERILFVDDEEFFSDLFSKMLSALGYRITTSVDSHNALSIFSKDPSAFDLLITDQTMPGMTGIELTREIHRIRPDLPVIICSGFSENLKDTSEEEFGASAILNKPVTRQEIALSIREVLDNR